MNEAEEPTSAERLECRFCEHRCRLAEGRTGICGVRENRSGTLVTTVYGLVAAAGIDPIEKKPFYHFQPGASTLSAALPGCNYRCAFCQNHDLSQFRESRWYPDPDRFSRTSPQELVDQLVSSRLSIMTYTYSDPVVWQDYMLDTAQLVKKQVGGFNCMVTNGSMTIEALEAMRGLIDGYSIDVKGGREFYRTWCGGELDPVLRNLDRLNHVGEAVVEVTTLVIEGIHTLEGIRDIGRMLADAGVQVWHISRFFPAYRMRDRAPTSEQFLAEALSVADESGIPYIYSGNSSDRSHSATRCPACGTVLIPSHSYGGEAGRAAVRTMERTAGNSASRCRACGAPVYGYL